jgi:hypothetical protein
MRNLKIGLFDIMHRELALGFAQAHFDALEPIIYNDSSFVAQEPELIGGWLDAIFSEIASSAAFFLPYLTG